MPPPPAAHRLHVYSLACSQATHQKIRFLPGDVAKAEEPGGESKLLAKLRELLDEELVDWVLLEMAAVRAHLKRRGPRPEYQLTALRTAVRAGSVPAPPAPLSSRQMNGSFEMRGRAASCDACRDPAARASSLPLPTATSDSALEQGATVPAGTTSDAAGARCAPGSGHSHYGCATLLRAYLKNPTLLGDGGSGRHISTPIPE
mmetsp:Transcript_16255/g.48411  ORF Transcript_16255/g.48411 Transcript_16255/m.48411 type:complete len:203 (-) Transcript_16255:377-985(-)